VGLWEGHLRSHILPQWFYSLG